MTISGRVQGVVFRQSTRARARQLELAGWVRNQPDGRVEAVFDGPPERVAEMLAWCHRGPPGASVSSVEVRDEPPDEPLAGFSVRPTE